MDIKKTPILLNVLLFLTFDLMLLGAGVRAMDAGLTCPDWPLCFGKAVPAYHFGVYLEFIHRAIAGLVGIIYVALFVQIWQKKALSHLKLLSTIGLFLLVAQIIMGGLTVLKLLEYYIVTLHLGLATFFLFVLYLMKRSVSTEKKWKLNTNFWGKAFRGTLLLALASVFVQILLGGLVASTYSGLICIDFPTCNGQFFPELKGPIGIQMVHRFGAYWLTTLISGVFLLALFQWRQIGLNVRNRKRAVMLFMLIFLQVYVGVMNLKLLMPALLTVFHLAIALSIMILLTFLVTSHERENSSSLL